MVFKNETKKKKERKKERIKILKTSNEMDTIRQFVIPALGIFITSSF